MTSYLFPLDEETVYSRKSFSREANTVFSNLTFINRIGKYKNERAASPGGIPIYQKSK